MSLNTLQSFSSSPNISPRLSGKSTSQETEKETIVITNANNTNNLASDALNSKSKSRESIHSPSASKTPKSLETESYKSSYCPDATLATMVSDIFRRFLVRMPHTFIAMALTFVPLYYGMEKESLAISASTFVGVGGTVYCFARAFFFEVIPHWMLPRDGEGKTWRRLMNITYTGFITVMFTTAVWKLPDLSAAQGLAFLLGSFGVPYILIAKHYPDIDKRPYSFERDRA